MEEREAKAVSDSQRMLLRVFSVQCLSLHLPSWQLSVKVGISPESGREEGLP